MRSVEPEVFLVARPKVDYDAMVAYLREAGGERSRVFSHEIVRHRPGTAVSQESRRYVRLDELPFWFPEWAREDAELMKPATALLTELEQFQHRPDRPRG
jgi:hypothetical protein